MLSLLVAFLAMLNPFALFVYLLPVMNELSHRNFVYVMYKASLISLGIYALFAVTGSFIFERVFHVNFESFRIFGGIIVFSFAYLFIVRGQKALILMKENLDDLAAEISLPFMVGAATISLAILLGRQFSPVAAVLGLAGVLAVNFMLIMFLKMLRQRIARRRFRVAFDKNMEIFMRLNGFLIGAFGVNMVVTGINNMYF